MADVPIDKFDTSVSGVVKATITGQRYHLRRPTIGENRAFLEALTGLQETNAAAREADTYDQAEAEHALFDWWREVFRTLDTSKLEGELPEDDDQLPPWFLAPDLIADTRAHWASVPWGPGGSPSQRAAAAADKTVGSLGRLLNAAGATPPPS